ncbi:hypothetical protein O1611_g1122 [Lasiodiplodia mahajangana]|uniref:Uncharacterized protein n=1 Tax=Lasiodiplodia mahajangana TaxID=1108764 RepID=A0ACC2JYS8_9PEZI|nr:hypothetical protein O1611_g1122 [Lasiodiplodia mahajangana]
MALKFAEFTEKQLFVFSIIVGTACIIATALRFVSTRRAGRNLGLEDWFALGALLSYLAYVLLELISISLVNGRDMETLSYEEFTRLGKVRTSATLVIVLCLIAYQNCHTYSLLVTQVLFATVPFYPLSQFFAKFSILFLYYRIFSFHPVFVRWMYIIGAIQLADSIITFFINIFSCIPIAYNWDITIDGWCLDQAAVFTGTESVNSAIDIAMVVLACLMLVELQLNIWTKLKLSLIFALGGLAGIIGFIRISQFYGVKNEVGVFSATNGFWENGQQATSVICCCVPVYKNMIPVGSFYTRLASRIGSSNWFPRLQIRSKPLREFGFDGEARKKNTEESNRTDHQWIALNESRQSDLRAVEIGRNHKFSSGRDLIALDKAEKRL